MIANQLDRLHAWLRPQPLFATFTTLTRILLAFGFIPPGMTKLLGHPFTIISPESPIGAFFEAFFQSGSYYAFVGLSQVLAGVLLLIPRTALLGAALYLPVICNVVVITIAMGFQGTWVITVFMLAANLYLLFWDWHRVRPILFAPTAADSFEPIRQSPRQLLAVLASCGLAFVAGGGLFVMGGWKWIPSTLGVAGVVLCVAAIPMGTAAAWQALRALAGRDAQA